LRFSYTWGLGGLSLLLFLILVLTGILLTFYYVPDVDRAYESMKDLRFAVPFGVFLRNVHRWSAQAMVLVVILHMARVFYTGSYKKPREFNWGIGVALLAMTLLLSFTGYLLPWDQLAYWAVTVGTNMARSTPFIGSGGPFHEWFGVRIDNDVRFALLGGTIVAQNALLRFYVLHCMAIPLIFCIMLAIHFWRIRKDGGISRPESAEPGETLAGQGTALAVREAEDTYPRDHDSGDPGIEIGEQLLQADKVPRRLGRIGRHGRVGFLLQGRIDKDGEHPQNDDRRERGDELADQQMRPGGHLVGGQRAFGAVGLSWDVG
jgi:quinol-cytochrome oxidoreductase complex cytochrome b subunit